MSENEKILDDISEFNKKIWIIKKDSVVDNDGVMPIFKIDLFAMFKHAYTFT